MNEEHQIPIYEEKAETAEEQEQKQRLKDIFSDLVKKQPDFLDEAAKSIIERIATFLAILFAVLALGGTFPPKFLVHNTQQYSTCDRHPCHLPGGHGHEHVVHSTPHLCTL